MADFKIYLTKMSLSYQGSEEERLCGDLLFSEKDIHMGDKRLNNLAAYTYNSVTCQKLFVMIEKALTPTENPWKTIYKSLLLLHTIVLFGSELAIDKAIDLCRFVRPLGTYNSALAKRGLFSGSGGTDYGAPVRAAAKTVDEILLTDASIRKARSDARQGQDSLVPMGDLLDDGSAAALADHNREFNPSHGVQMNYGQGLTTSVGAGFGLQAVPGIYEGRPERYFDSDSTRKNLLQPKSVQDSQITRDAQAPSLLDMVFDDTGMNMTNLPPADYLPALEKQRELEAQLLAQQEQLRQLQDLQREQQRLQELQRAQQQQQHQQQASLLQFPFAGPPQGPNGPNGAPYGAPGAPPAYNQHPGAMNGGMGSLSQPYQPAGQFQGMGMGGPPQRQLQGLGQQQGMQAQGMQAQGMQAQGMQQQQQPMGAFDDLLGLSNASAAAPAPASHQYGHQQQQQPPRQQPSPYSQPQAPGQGPPSAMGGGMGGAMGGGMGGGMGGMQGAPAGYAPQQLGHIHGHSPAYGQGMGQGASPAMSQSPFSPVQSPPHPHYQGQSQGQPPMGGGMGMGGQPQPYGHGQPQGFGGSPYGGGMGGAQSPVVQAYPSPQGQALPYQQQQQQHQAVPNQGMGYNGHSQAQPVYQQQGQYGAPPVPGAPAGYASPMSLPDPYSRAPPPVPSAMPSGPPPPVPAFAPPPL